MKLMFCKAIAGLSSARWLSVFFVMLAASSNAELVAYKGANLIDGTLSGVVENATIVVGGDKFVAVGTLQGSRRYGGGECQGAVCRWCTARRGDG